jgi:hypothetical protein
MNNTDFIVPDFLDYMTFYTLDNAVDIHNFIQDMENDGTSISKYPDIKIYYDILLNNAFAEEPNMITVNYVVKKIRILLLKYKLAHTSKIMQDLTGQTLYYYWNDRRDAL